MLNIDYLILMLNIFAVKLQNIQHSNSIINIQSRPELIEWHNNSCIAKHKIGIDTILKYETFAVRF